MPGVELLARLKEVSGCFELYHVTEYQGYRHREDGTVQQVTIKILDAGAEERFSQYHVHAEANDGRRATGNAADSIETTLAIVHWGDLNRDR